VRVRYASHVVEIEPKKRGKKKEEERNRGGEVKES
jgi:hypothetical protein